MPLATDQSRFTGAAASFTAVISTGPTCAVRLARQRFTLAITTFVIEVTFATDRPTAVVSTDPTIAFRDTGNQLAPPLRVAAVSLRTLPTFTATPILATDPVVTARKATLNNGFLRFNTLLRTGWSLLGTPECE
jgi:hypothetical protein